MRGVDEPLQEAPSRGLVSECRPDVVGKHSWASTIWWDAVHQGMCFLLASPSVSVPEVVEELVPPLLRLRAPEECVCPSVVFRMEEFFQESEFVFWTVYFYSGKGKLNSSDPNLYVVLVERHEVGNRKGVARKTLWRLSQWRC